MRGDYLIAWAVGMGVLVLSLGAFAQRAERTSENSTDLQEMLERRPEADLNKDGILTAEELQAARKERTAARKARAREGVQKKPGKPKPKLADVAYGDHERHRVDFWQAKLEGPRPLFVWIHGGGFRAGDKSSIPPALLNRCLDAGISCASINYRLSHHAPYPAPMHDSARAIQFLRSKAAEWDLDPKRFAAGGGSAGAGISQWIGYHDDMAKPDSADPVARQSTRLSCVLPINMQSIYDPRVIKKIIPGDAYKNSALVLLFGRPEGWDWDTDVIDDALDALLKDAGPITHLSADDPPIYLINYAKANIAGNIHHSNFGKYLKEAADKLGVECVRHMDSDYESMDAVYAGMVEFLKKHFGMKGK